jgi:periplasmic divalent cation tolerance protein
MSALRLLLTTFANEEQAAEAVRTLAREQLVACGTLLPRARSIYIWQGNLEDAEEIVVVLKTTPAAVDAAAARLKELHSYEVPEILVLSPESASPAYTRWVSENTVG